MIPFLDMKAVYAELKPELDAAFARVMESGWFVLGKEVEAFEAEYAAFCGTKHCVGLGNGLEALELVLVAVNGACRAQLDDGAVKEAVLLDDPARALYIGTWVWHELTDFAPGTAVVVIASTLYDEAEYLRDYEIFTREVGAHR